MNTNEYDEVRSGVIQAGYMQQDSNDEDLVDFGDACRIACEDESLNYGERVNGWLATMTETEMAELESEFNHEFGIAEAVPGSSTFWQDLKSQIKGVL